MQVPVVASSPCGMAWHSTLKPFCRLTIVRYILSTILYCRHEYLMQFLYFWLKVRTMQWSHNDVWMVTGDHAGYIKYWQSNMNNVKMFQVFCLQAFEISGTHNFIYPAGSQRSNQKSVFLPNWCQVRLLQWRRHGVLWIATFWHNLLLACSLSCFDFSWLISCGTQVRIWDFQRCYEEKVLRGHGADVKWEILLLSSSHADYFWL